MLLNKAEGFDCLTPKIYKKSEHHIYRENIEPEALAVIRTLQKSGFKAFIVGGSIRDILLKKVPKDFDISTSAKPEEVKKLFPRCFLIGRRFRLAHVHVKSKTIEVATFRKGNNADDSLIVQDNEWGTEKQDVLRRDFTINGLLYNPFDETIIDYVNGYEDAKKAALKTIGDPFIRFKQDPVRMIRLLKFQARFNAHIEKCAIEALFFCQKEILKSSKARILEEIFRMLESGYSLPFIKLMIQYQLLPLLMPNLSSSITQKNSSVPVFKYLQKIDQIILSEKKRKSPRTVLLSCLMFPFFKNHLISLHKDREKPMHLGLIEAEAVFLTQHLFAPFLRIPKKLLHIISSILTLQMHVTPLKPTPKKIPGMPNFSLGLKCFALRSFIEPSLQKEYFSWLRLWKQKSSKRKKKQTLSLMYEP